MNRSSSCAPSGDETGAIKAFYNVCAHRGRQLVDVPRGSHGVRGNRRSFICGFHGWTYDLDGKNTYILDADDWHGALDAECTSLTPVRFDTWGGYVYVDMREEGESLAEFLGDAGRILAHFELDKMRYKWRQWCRYPANWKTSIEAFMEPYHATSTHHQLTAYAEFYAYSKAYGLHSVSGFDQRKSATSTTQGGSVSRAGKGDDPRVSTYELARENYTTINYSASTDTLIAAASRLKDELPEGTGVGEVMAHWMASAKADDAARGVTWPEIPPEVMAEAGLAWSLFPNQNILHGVTFALCYRSRPCGDDPDMCIFEAYALERYPEGQEPQTEWVEAEPTEAGWGKVLAQDFAQHGIRPSRHEVARVSAVRCPTRTRNRKSSICTATWPATSVRAHRGYAHELRRSEARTQACPADLAAAGPGRADQYGDVRDLAEGGRHPGLQADPRPVRGRGHQDAVRHPRSQLRPPLPRSRGARVDRGLAAPRGSGRLHGRSRQPHHRQACGVLRHARAGPRQHDARDPVLQGREFAGDLPRRPARPRHRAPRASGAHPVRPAGADDRGFGQVFGLDRICRPDATR